MVGGKYYDDKFCRNRKRYCRLYDFNKKFNNVSSIKIIPQDGKCIFCVLRAFEENFKTIA